MARSRTAHTASISSETPSLARVRPIAATSSPVSSDADGVNLVRIDVRAAAGYLGCMDDPLIAPSALKHGLTEDEILHAYRHPIRAWDMGDGFTMIIGPNRAALILEVGYVQGTTTVVIVHAMRAREKFMR